MPSLPKFRVTDIRIDDNVVIGALSATDYQGERWIDDNWLGDLRDGDQFVEGRWRQLEGTWSFSPTEPSETAHLKVGEAYDAIDGYWSQRLRLITDESIQWRNAHWTNPSDHDHCEICWATIAALENASYFRGHDRVAICEDCYVAYIKDRNLDLSALGGPVAA